MSRPQPNKITENKPSRPGYLLVPGMKALLLIATGSLSSPNISGRPFSFTERVISNSTINDNGSAVNINASIDPISIQITNHSNENRRAMVFGAYTNFGIGAINFGNPTSISITGIGLTYSQLMQMTINRPVIIGRIMLSSSTADQALQALEISNTNPLGMTSTYIQTPYIDPFQQMATISSVGMFFQLDNGAMITITILPLATLTLTLYPRA